MTLFLTSLPAGQAFLRQAGHEGFRSLEEEIGLFR